MKSFSQRKGIVKVEEVIQLNRMNESLRNSLWNALDVGVWSTDNFMYRQYGAPDIDAFTQSLWFHYFKKPIDSRPRLSSDKLKIVREYFFECQWNEVYDFIEFVVDRLSRSRKQLPDLLNAILERESSGYRIVSGHIVDITSEQEVKMLEEAIRDTRFAGVAGHLERALELLSNRENPDYRNSIKESVSAIESMARIVAENPKATLPDALKSLEKNGRLHTALKDGFVKLYGYTSDEQGIRHAMLDDPNITASDARYFLLSCTSFANYLKAQLP
jgi:AbiJ N-terminal domain 4